MNNHNQLLASLPGELVTRLMSRMQLVDLNAGATLFETGGSLRHVHFPVTAVVSLISPLQSGASTEVAVVGREGMVGVCAFMGGSMAMSSAVVQHAGQAWRIGAGDIAELAHESAPLMQGLLRYTQFLLTHMAQKSVCHRHHSLASQLCCWMLQHSDRLGDTDMRITHERIAGMLGVRREGVTEAAAQLQREGLISYRRGVMQVVDRSALKDRSCECYGVVGQAFQQLNAGHSSGAAQGRAAWANYSSSRRSHQDMHLAS